MVEIYFNVQSDNGSITDQHALRRWSTQYMRALEDRKDLRVASRLRNHFLSSGLVEVDSKMIPLPLSAWSNGQSLLSLTKDFNLTVSRSKNASHWAVQQRQHPGTSSILGPVSSHSTVAYVGAEL
jgi:hypothetical protein